MSATVIVLSPWKTECRGTCMHKPYTGSKGQLLCLFFMPTHILVWCVFKVCIDCSKVIILGPFILIEYQFHYCELPAWFQTSIYKVLCFSKICIDYWLIYCCLPYVKWQIYILIRASGVYTKLSPGIYDEFIDTKLFLNSIVTANIYMKVLLYHLQSMAYYHQQRGVTVFCPSVILVR